MKRNIEVLMGITSSNGFEETRELSRIEVRWPVTLMTEKGSVEGEARNITAKGVYILFKHTTEELTLNETYRLLIKPPGEKIVVSGKLIWSNLDIMPRMGFCFAEFSEGDRELLLEAIRKYARE